MVELQVTRVLDNFPRPNGFALVSIGLRGTSLSVYHTEANRGHEDGNMANLEHAIVPSSGVLMSADNQNEALRKFSSYGTVSPATESMDGIQFGSVVAVDVSEGENTTQPRENAMPHLTTRAVLYPSAKYAGLVRIYHEALQKGVFYPLLFSLSKGMTASQLAEFKLDPDAFVDRVQDKLASQK